MTVNNMSPVNKNLEINGVYEGENEDGLLATTSKMVDINE